MRKLLMVATALLALGLAACGGFAATPTSRPVETTGRAVFAVSDAAADMGTVTAVNVTIDSLRVHAQGGAWTTVSTGAQTFELLELNATGTAQLLAQADLEAGAYDQLELNVSQVVVVDAQGEHQAKLPSHKLHINAMLEVKAGATATANFDFIAHQSLHLTGEGTYVLAPVVQLETRAEAQTKVESNNQVTIRGGQTTSDVQVGMDVEGTVDTGLRIAPDAVLGIAASGKVVQTRGQALVHGTIKAVDTATGTVTFTTRGGVDLVLQASGDSTIKVGSSAATMAELAANVGSEAAVRYNAGTKTIAAIAAQANAEAKAEIGNGLDLSGTVTSVNVASGSVTVTADSGANVVVKVGPEAPLPPPTQAPALAPAPAPAEAQATASATATASVSGTLKAVNVAAGTVTIATQAGADVVLKVAADTRLLLDGTVSTLASPAASIGSQVQLEYNIETMVATSIQVHSPAPAHAPAPAPTPTPTPTPAPATATASISAHTQGQAPAPTPEPAPEPTPAPAPTPTPAPAPAPTPTPAPAAATASVSGTLKAVNVVGGTVTIATQAGADVVLSVTSSTQVLLNGSVSALATLATSIGAQANATYNIQTNAVITLNVQG